MMVYGRIVCTDDDGSPYSRQQGEPFLLVLHQVLLFYWETLFLKRQKDMFTEMVN